VLKVHEDFFDHHRVFDAGHVLDAAAATLADLDVSLKYALQALLSREGNS